MAHVLYVEFDIFFILFYLQSIICTKKLNNYYNNDGHLIKKIKKIKKINLSFCVHVIGGNSLFRVSENIVLSKGKRIFHKQS
jgi:hypothetical protein